MTLVAVGDTPLAKPRRAITKRLTENRKSIGDSEPAKKLDYATEKRRVFLGVHYRELPSTTSFLQVRKSTCRLIAVCKLVQGGNPILSCGMPVGRHVGARVVPEIQRESELPFFGTRQGDSFTN